MKPELLSCVICGHQPWNGEGVRMALIRWRDGDGRFGAGPRCSDVEACRRRVLDAGEDWPLSESWDRVPA